MTNPHQLPLVLENVDYKKTTTQFVKDECDFV